jgi:hypothetical protein
MDQPISNTAPQDTAVQEAMARRGLNAPSQQAPMMSGGTSAPPMGGQPPAPQAQPMSAPAPQSKQEFTPTNGHDFILTTLAEQLKNDHKLDMERLKMNSPQIM